ncbi:MAG: hypothetical protein QM756_20065 [Polyangiaceae bacterium]
MGHPHTFVAASCSFTLFLAQATFALAAEPAPAANTLALELGGTSYVASLGYERRVFDFFALRMGAGAMRFCSETCKTVWLAPASASVLIGRTAHLLETGVGVLGLSLDPSILPVGVLGYRYHPPQGGLVLRLAFTPFLVRERVLPWGGALVGYSF